MTDDSSISEYNIDEKKFIVIMVTKPKAPPVPSTGPSDPTITVTPTCTSGTSTNTTITATSNSITALSEDSQARQNEER